MSRTIEDLRETLAAGVRDLPPSSARTVAVHRRVRTIRRRRAVSALAVVAVLASGGVLTVQAAQRHPEEAASPRLAEWTQGGRLFDSVTIDAATSATASVTFIPSGNVSSMEPGLTPGTPANLQVRLTMSLGPTGQTLTDAERRKLDGAKVRIGLDVPVPRSHYVFPPRPKTLDKLYDTGEPGGLVLPQEDPSTRTTQVDLSYGLDLTVDAVEPGVVTAELNGRRVEESAFWRYGVQGASIQLTTAQLAALGITGGTATLTLWGTDFTDQADAWQVTLVSHTS